MTWSLRSMDEAMREVSVIWSTMVRTFWNSSSGISCIAEDSSLFRKTCMGRGEKGEEEEGEEEEGEEEMGGGGGYVHD